MSIEDAFFHFPTLTTKRLQLRQISIKDAEAFFPILSDPIVMRYHGNEPHVSLEETKLLLQSIQSNYIRQESMRWGITLKGSDRLIGSCGYHHFGPAFRHAEIGYELNRAYWQQGIMSEAVAALLDCGFNELGFHRVEANIDIENIASKQLLLKLGFTFEGNLRQRFFFRDHFEDEYYFGLLKDEWLQKRRP